MNEFYETVDQVIKQGLQENSLEALRKKAKKSDQAPGVHLDIPYNVEYIVKRFINASMSTDPEIRNNASTALRSFVHCFIIEVDQSKLVKFIIEASNYKKSGNKKNENEAYATGRILAFKSMASLVKDSVEAFNSLKQIIQQFPNLEQEVIQACYLITHGKTLKIKFHSFSPKNEVSRFLYKILLRSKDPEADQIEIQEVHKIIEAEVEKYPAQSLALEYFGNFIKFYTDTPSEFFTQYGNKFLDNDQESEVNIHEIYYVMIIFKAYLESITITTQNYQAYFSKKMVAVWLEQLRVMNKKMKELAQSITISFNEEDPELAYQILVTLHEEGIYMENISLNHPLQQLYTQVNPQKYWKYLYDLCVEAENKEQQSAELQKQMKQEYNEEQQSSYFNQLQFFVCLHQKKISLNNICTTMVFLLDKYHSDNQNKQILYLIINLMGEFCNYRTKKNKAKDLILRHKLFKNMMKVLRKIKISELTKIEQQKKLEIRKCLLWLKKKTTHIVQEGREDCPSPQIKFYIFYASLIFFSLIYPEEVETLQELQPVFSDLSGLYEVRDEPKKKVKKSKRQDGEDPKKPIHVLIDIFISLMTKPTNFLRSSIHSLYESILPFMDQTDIQSLVTVITTPDAEFIEQI